MNMELLQKKIDESGLKNYFIAEKVGIDRVSLYNKLNGKTEFTMTEIIKLCEVLRLSDSEKVKIFFRKNMN